MMKNRIVSIMFSKIYRWHILPLFVFALLILLTPSAVHADGGAPNLAYVAGATKGIAVIDVSQQKVTGNIAIPGDPHTILLSVDARFLYVTQPQMGQVAILSAKTGETICTAQIAGQPALMALDPGSNTLYTAGNGASSVSALDATNCNIKHTFQTNGPVYGLAIAMVGSGVSGSTGNQLWIANGNSLTIFDDLQGQQIGNIAIPGGPQYVIIPPGGTVYVTTRQNSVVGVDLTTHKIIPLITGGTYGPMDYDANTGEVYVPDQQNNRLIVLTPVNAGFTTPHEPNRVIDLGVQPKSVAITSDGQLGFVALARGNVAMLDIPGRQIITTIFVGGNPHFIITGLYPPAIGNTPQQASILTTILNVAAYIFVIALLIVPILLFRRYARTHGSSDEAEKNE